MSASDPSSTAAVLASLTDTLTSSPSTWHNSSLLSVTQITPPGLRLLFRTAAAMRTLVRTHGGDDRLRHKLLATVFYEASTRTSCSFQAAMLRLGGKVVHVDAGKGGNSSSSAKGESLEDTVRCLECYVDATVLRHFEKGSVPRVALGGGTSKPVINAGDGVGEHPTQALLDLFTIWDELGLCWEEDGADESTEDAREKVHEGPLVVVMLGDLKHGRTVHSLAMLLARSSMKHRVILRYCSPPSLAMPSYVREYVGKFAGVTQEECGDLKEAVRDAHVLYVTRVQKERFESVDEYEEVKGAYVVDANIMHCAPSNMIVMHPLPRVDEISTEVDKDPRACYFRQMENGMFVRMAILALIMGCP
ncbi:hypothetical protein ACHAW6_007635 [Cyclotella cf. meneghiniana]